MQTRVCSGQSSWMVTGLRFVAPMDCFWGRGLWQKQLHPGCLEDYFCLFRMTKAAITPGTQPARVSRNTMSTEPQPLSNTERGGKKMASRTLRKDIKFALRELLGMTCLALLKKNRNHLFFQGKKPGIAFQS